MYVHIYVYGTYTKHDEGKAKESHYPSKHLVALGKAPVPVLLLCWLWHDTIWLEKSSCGVDKL